MCNKFPHFRQYSNVYYKHWEKGVYKCVVCGVDQFLSSTKYDSGSGWPSFYDVVNKQNIRKRADASGGKKLHSFTKYLKYDTQMWKLVRRVDEGILPHPGLYEIHIHYYVLLIGI